MYFLREPCHGSGWTSQLYTTARTQPLSKGSVFHSKTRNELSYTFTVALYMSRWAVHITNVEQPQANGCIRSA